MNSVIQIKLCPYCGLNPKTKVTFFGNTVLTHNCKTKDFNGKITSTQQDRMEAMHEVINIWNSFVDA